MEYQSDEEKLAYLKTNIEADIDHAGEKSYRAAARLRDGTFLPCVRFRHPATEIQSVTERFELARAGKVHYYGNDSPELDFQMEVKGIVLFGNRVNFYDIARIEPSLFALPPGVLQSIESETTMGWTGFAARMHDGKCFGFGASNFDFAFFEMPDGYKPADIKEIISHAYVLKTGEVRHHQRGFLDNPPDYQDAVVHTPRLFFDCFIDEF